MAGCATETPLQLPGDTPRPDPQEVDVDRVRARLDRDGDGSFDVDLPMGMFTFNHGQVINLSVFFGHYPGLRLRQLTNMVYFYLRVPWNQ